LRVLPYSRFVDMVEWIAEEKRREEEKEIRRIELETKDRYRQAAFIAWQLGAGDGMTFSEYVRGLFGDENDAEHAPEPEITKEKALEEAERILALFREEGAQ
jgi:hypothetical protein